MNKKLCIYPACKCFAIDGKCYCQKHYVPSKPFANAKRTNTWYNTTEWKQLRKQILAENNVCEECGKTEIESGFSLELHHINPPKGNRDLFFEMANIKVLCKVCHARATAYEQQK